MIHHARAAANNPVQAEWPDFLALRAVSHAAHLALEFERTTWTFAELDRQVNAVAHALTVDGVRESARVAVLASNSPAYVLLAHGLIRLGAVLVPLNVRLTSAELAWQVNHVGARLLLHDHEHAQFAETIHCEAPKVRIREIGNEDASDLHRRSWIASDTLHSIVFTSGTSGRPKGAKLTYGNFVASAISSALHLGHHRDDRWLAAMPLFHVGGLAILMRSVVCGITVRLHDRFDPGRANRAIDEGKITIISVVANMLQRMLDERGGRPYPDSLRCVLLGGGPAPHSLIAECLRLGVPVAPSFGMTETCSQAATLLPQEVADRPGSSGRPLPFTDIAVTRDGQRLSAGEIGEIVVRGPTVTPGYIGERAVQDDGWLPAGDLGHLDEDGYLYVADRRDDLIISGGENVYPAEVESVLRSHPAIDDAAVVGRIDDEWGEVPVAFVTLMPGVEFDTAAIMNHCRTSLASYKVPRQITPIDEIPRNAAGKVQRRKLRDAIR